MAKTIFQNGTTILSKWLNSVFGFGAKDLWAATTAYAAGDVIKLSGGEILRCLVAGTSGSSEPAAPGALRGTVVDGTVTWELFGGHLHDQRDFDGSAPKILLTGGAEVTGTLPVANQVEHVHSGEAGQFAKIILTDALGVTGTLPVANQVEHVHSGAGGQFAKIDLGSAAHVTGVLPAANLYNKFGDVLSEGNFNITWPDSIFSVEIVSKCSYRKIVPHDTNMPTFIFLLFEEFAGTSVSTALTLPGDTIPEALWPDTDTVAYAAIIDNTTAVHGQVGINAAGALQILRFDGAAFTNSGQKGLKSAFIIYPQWP